MHLWEYSLRTTLGGLLVSWNQNLSHGLNHAIFKLTLLKFLQENLLHGLVNVLLDLLLLELLSALLFLIHEIVKQYLDLAI